MDVATDIDFKFLYQQEKKEKEQLQVELMKMQLQLQKFAQMIFGNKSERFTSNPAQLALEINAETIYPQCSIGQAKKIEYVLTDEPKKRILSELGAYLKGLPRVFETREPGDIPEGAVKIGEDTYKVWNLYPAGSSSE